MEVRVCSEPISSRSSGSSSSSSSSSGSSSSSSSGSSSSTIVVPSRYSEFETADEKRKPLGGCGIGGGGKPYRKLWEWVDGSDGIRVVVVAAVRKGVQEGKRKKLPAAAAARTEGRRTDKKAAAAAVNGKGKRKSEEERGRPSVGGPHRCGARRGQSAAA